LTKPALQELSEIRRFII